MTQEEKDLLLKDLTARLPYGVKCSYPYGVGTLQSIDLEDMSFTFDCPSDDNYYEIDGIRPYLRPMSSMTEEERQEYGLVLCDELSINQFDWLNAHHFDYRDLIGKGLALEAPKGMYDLS